MKRAFNIGMIHFDHFHTSVFILLTDRSTSLLTIRLIAIVELNDEVNFSLYVFSEYGNSCFVKTD